MPMTFDPQDPLPESNWLWRRVFVFLVTAAILWMLWGAIARLGVSALASPGTGIAALLTLCKWLIGFDAMMATYYMVAPSAEQITKAIQIAKSWRHGVEVGAARNVPEKPPEDEATPAPPAPLIGVVALPPDPAGTKVME